MAARNTVVMLPIAQARHAVLSRSQYECHKGFLMAGVVLRGEVVRLGRR